VTVRRRLLLLVLAALAVALALSTVGFNVLFERTTATSADSLLRSRAGAQAQLVTLRGGRLLVPRIAAEGRIWVFDPRGTVERPRVRSAADAPARALAGGPARFLDVGGQTRLYARPILRDGRRVGTVVAAVSMRPYEEAEKNALLGSLALALAMIVLVGFAVWWLLRSALRPVVRMTEQAAVWSERDLDRRFDLGEPHDELTQLASTLDGLLDRLAASLRHERRFSAELSHELKTPLARVIAEAEVTLRRERDAPEYRAALERTLRSARQVERIVTTLVTAAQQEAGATPGTADAYAVAVEATEAVAALADERHVALTAEEPAGPIRLGVDGQLAERVLQPILENACRYGRSWARVRIVRQGSKVIYRVEDDGPGVAAEEQAAIFEPGVRGSRSESGGAGLGLALARRLARTASGDVTLEDGGFVVSLPAG
jgi:two-component system OmpR family sensor kinase